MRQHSPPTPGQHIRYGRPGVLATLAPLSIVVASLALVGGLLGAGCSWSTLRIAGETNNRARSYVQKVIEAQATSRPAELAEVVQVRTAAAVRRAGVVDALAELQSLPGDGKRHLDLLLARHGADILPAAVRQADGNSAAALNDLVKDRGRDEVQAWFDFLSGRLMVTRDRAVFRPKAGGEDLSASAKDTATAVVPADPDPFASPSELQKLAPVEVSEKVLTDPPNMKHASGLTTKQINSVVAQVQKQVNGALNPQQKLLLARELQTVNPPLVPPEQAYSAVRFAQVDPSGTATIYLVGGALTISSGGVVSDRMGSSIETVTMTPLAVSLVVADTVLGIALALLLLLAAILLIRRSSWAIAAHRLYAVLKIPAVIIGLVGYRWVQADFDAGISRLSRSGARMESFGVAWQVVIVLGAVYAVVLLFVLSSRTVRNYERSPGD